MWCAGFFQGEGYVGIRNKNGIKALDIGITQYYDRTPLDRFAEFLETGSVNGPYSNSKTNECYQYRKTGIDAEAALEKILPYLSGKKLEQAQNALNEMKEYRESRGGFNKKNRKKNTKTHCPSGHDYSKFGKINPYGYTICKTCHAEQKRKLRKKKI